MTTQRKAAVTGSAARRHEHHGAGGRVVHILRWFDGRPACGALVENVVRADERRVTCAACKRTRAWLERGRVPGERRA